MNTKVLRSWFRSVRREGFRMSNAIPPTHSLHRTASMRSLRAITEGMEDKKSLALKDQADTDKASPKLAEANDGLGSRPSNACSNAPIMALNIMVHPQSCHKLEPTILPITIEDHRHCVPGLRKTTSNHIFCVSSWQQQSVDHSSTQSNQKSKGFADRGCAI